MPEAAALIVDRWISEGKEVVYRFAPVTNPRIILPGEELIIASETDLKCKQGVLWHASGFITSPVCATRFEHKDFDTGSSYRVDTTLLSGENMPNNALWARGPPDTPFYTFVLMVPFTWQTWARVSFINLDVVPITLLASLYLVAMVKEPSPGDRVLSLKTLKKMQLAYEMYPEARKPMREKLARQVDSWLEEFKVKDVELARKVKG